MFAFQPIQPIFDILLVDLERVRNHRRIEIHALHGGGRQQLPGIVAKRVQLPLDHAAHRFGQFAFDGRKALREHPAAARILDEDAPTPQIAEQIDQEERVPFRPLVDQSDEFFRERVVGELQRDVFRDGRWLQVLKVDLPARAPRLQIELQRQERVLRLDQLRGPIRHHHREAHRGQPVGQISEQVHRRAVGPMEIVEKHHYRLQSRRLLEEGRHLALHALLRSGARLCEHPRRRRVVRRQRHDLHVPVRRDRFQHASEVAVALAAQQRVDGLEKRQVRLAAGQPLRTPPACDARFTRAGQEAEAVLDERGLPQPGLARDRDQQAVSRGHFQIRLGEQLHFRLAAHQSWRRRRPAVRRGGTDEGGRLVAAQSRRDFGRRGAHAGVFLQALERELIEGGGQLDAHPRGRNRCVRQDPVQDRQGRAGMERMLARQHLVEDDAVGEHVAGQRDAVAAGLLGRHVADRAEHQTGARRTRQRRLVLVTAAGDAREAEVEHLHVAIVAHHHVVWLDVAVHDLRGVRDGQRLRDLARDVDGAIEREALPHRLPQAAALHELHRDEAPAFELAGLVDGDDVGMVEGRDGERFPDETIDRVGFRREPARDQLDRDVAPQPLVEGPIDLAHAARSEQGVHDIGPEPRTFRQRHPRDDGIINGSLRSAEPVDQHLSKLPNQLVADVVRGIVGLRHVIDRDGHRDRAAR